MEMRFSGVSRQDSVKSVAANGDVVCYSGRNGELSKLLSNSL